MMRKEDEELKLREQKLSEEMSKVQKAELSQTQKA
jgi:hypothetical protein